jgi:hypothetical protein
MSDPHTAETVIATMRERFTSGNGIPVERAHIKADEWALIEAEFNRLAFLDSVGLERGFL